MRPALLIPAVAVALIAATPSLACRIPSETVRAEAVMPQVGVIATVEALDRIAAPNGVETASLILSVSQVLDGNAPARITLSATITDEVIVTCGPARLEGRALTALPIGAQVIATGIQPEGAAPDIRRVALLDSTQGRDLLARLERNRRP